MKHKTGTPAESFLIKYNLATATSLVYIQWNYSLETATIHVVTSKSILMMVSFDTYHIIFR